MTRSAGAFLVLALCAAVVFSLAEDGPRVELGPGDDIQLQLDLATPGTTVVVAPGTYTGTWVIENEMTLEAEGVRLVAPPNADVALSIVADDVTISGLEITGASSGIVVREAERVTLREFEIESSELHGIEIVDASATISDAWVHDLVNGFAQGIEIRNSDGRPDTIVEDSRILGGQEGIVSHVSEVVLSNNHVIGTTMRGIVVTEMSDGVVRDNRVVAATGAGYYCGDMSRCAFEGNVASDIAAGSGGTSEAGWGLVVTYHASASSSGDRLIGDAGSIHTSIHGKMLERSPLDPGSLSDIAAPAAISIAVTLALMGGSALLARPLARRLEAGRAKTSKVAVFGAFTVALVVQSFHMVEHVLQVHRVTVDHVPSRGGLAGPGVDSEWVHLAYNLTLLAFLVAVSLAAKGLPSRGTAALIGAVSVQSWHGVEHIAKVAQHVVTGAKVNPGVIGGNFDLVWFHFTVNLTVYLLCLAAGLLWLTAAGRNRSEARVTVDPLPA